MRDEPERTWADPVRLMGPEMVEQVQEVINFARANAFIKAIWPKFR
jgi:hypothetical protein